MKKVLFICLALLTSSLIATASNQAAMSPLDTLQVYTINGEQVNNFDGSQLAHKFISNYQLKTTPSSANGKEVIQTHDIKTPTSASPLVILDDAVISTVGNTILNKLDPANIKGIEVIKDDKKQEALFKKYLGKYDEETRKKYQGIIIITSIDKEKSENVCKQLSQSEPQTANFSILPQSYIIDGNKIQHFDGSQLEGKNIGDYKISIDTIATPKNTLIATHQITIDKNIHIRGSQSTKVSTEKKSKPERKYIINGKLSSKEEVNKLDPSSIKGMTILKAGSKGISQYSSDPNDPNDYIVITTKK